MLGLARTLISGGMNEAQNGGTLKGKYGERSGRGDLRNS